MTGALSGDAQTSVRAAWSRAWWACALATCLAGVLSLGFFLWWLMPPGVSHRRGGAVFCAVFAVYILSIAPFLHHADRERSVTVERWAGGGAPPDDPGRRLVLREARRQAASTFVVWAGGSVVFVGTDFVLGRTMERSAVLLFGALLGGAYVASWVFLIAERALRPCFAIALAAGDPVVEGRIDVRVRLTAAWATGSGIPLLGIGLALVWKQLNRDAADMTGPLWALVGTGLLAGFLVIVTAARSVAEPVEAVRAGLARVADGDLNAHVPVADSTELGLLQAGFNRMVAGLREAERLHDLFGRHVGVEVARNALESGVDFEGEQAEATLLFIDLIGSTAMVETRSARDVMSLLNTMFRAVVEVVETEGGWVNKFQGDAALCVFGPPDGRPGHAARALRAATTINRRLSTLAPSLPGLDAGIGVSTGPVVTGHLGTSTRYEYGIVGDAANEAARLSDFAKHVAGRVLASSQTIEHAGEVGASWHDAGFVQLRGRSTPTRVFQPPEATSHERRGQFAPLA